MAGVGRKAVRAAVLYSVVETEGGIEEWARRLYKAAVDGAPILNADGEVVGYEWNAAANRLLADYVLGKPRLQRPDPTDDVPPASLKTLPECREALAQLAQLELSASIDPQAADAHRRTLQLVMQALIAEQGDEEDKSSRPITVIVQSGQSVDPETED